MTDMFRRRRSEGRTNGRSPIWWGVTAILLVTTALTIWSYAIDGTSAALRTAAETLMPIGTFWIVSLGLTATAMRANRWSAVAVTGLFVLSLGFLGHASIANHLISSVEWPPGESADNWLSADPQKPLEAVIVLGGSVGNSIDGNPELGRDGERVFTAAQFWHMGLAKQIYVTGSSVTGDAPAVKATKLLTSVGVPAEALVPIEGLNTVAEMQNLQTHFAKTKSTSDSIGLITSAFHMRRAMRLAKEQGMSFVPLPVAYRGRNPSSIASYHIVPTVDSLKISTLAIRERIAGLLGR